MIGNLVTMDEKHDSYSKTNEKLNIHVNSKQRVNQIVFYGQLYHLSLKICVSQNKKFYKKDLQE